MSVGENILKTLGDTIEKAKDVPVENVALVVVGTVAVVAIASKHATQIGKGAVELITEKRS